MTDADNNDFEIDLGAIEETSSDEIEIDLGDLGLASDEEEAPVVLADEPEADADEDEQDEAAGNGSDEYGAAAASGGVHPGVLPDEIRITRQVHHGTQRQGNGGGSGCFAAHVSCSAGGIQESDRRGDGGLEYRPLLTR